MQMRSIPRWFPTPGVPAVLLALLFSSAALHGQISGSLSGTTGAAVIQTELVRNGGFEDGAAERFSIGGTAVGGGGAPWIEGTLGFWNVGPSTNSPNVLATNESDYFATVSNGDPPGGGPRSGSVAAVFPNTPQFDGYISQAISGVVAGDLYRISFWLSNQVGDAPLNFMDVKWGGTIATAGAPLTGGTSLAGGSPAIPGAIPVQTGWTRYEFTVTAPENNARLTFIGGNSSAANLIDDVSVVLIPEATTFTMLGAGMLLMGLRRIRRGLAA